MTKVIQIGSVYGDLKSVELEDTATLGDALRLSGQSLTRTQQVMTDTAVSANTSDVPRDGGIFFIGSRDTSGK